MAKNFGGPGVGFLGSFLVLVAVRGASPYSLSGCFACACVVVWLFGLCFSLFRWCLFGGVFLLAVYVFGVVVLVLLCFVVFCVGWSSCVRVWPRAWCGLGVPCCVVVGRSLCGSCPGLFLPRFFPAPWAGVLWGRVCVTILSLLFFRFRPCRWMVSLLRCLRSRFLLASRGGAP